MEADAWVQFLSQCRPSLKLGGSWWLVVRINRCVPAADWARHAAVAGLIIVYRSRFSWEGPVEGSASGGSLSHHAATRNESMRARVFVRAYWYKDPVVCNHDHPNKPPRVRHNSIPVSRRLWFSWLSHINLNHRPQNAPRISFKNVLGDISLNVTVQSQIGQFERSLACSVLRAGGLGWAGRCWLEVEPEPGRLKAS